jgi:DNA polymerase I
MLGALPSGRVVRVSGPDVVEQLQAAGVTRGDIIGLALAPGVGVAMSAMATASGGLSILGGDASIVVSLVEDALRPRWAWWSSDTAGALVSHGVRVATCWDIAAAHRMLFGGWRADPARVWAQIHDLPLDAIPAITPIDLFNYSLDDGDPEDPLQADGYLRPEWANGGWSASGGRLVRWAELASQIAALQQAALAALAHRPRATATVRSESAAELLCAELCADGLPMDRAVAEDIITNTAGPRPNSAAEAAEIRARRDAEVLRHAPMKGHVDLRSPGQVRSLLQSVGFDLPDTRAWRLKELRSMHPLVEALLAWRKAERVATTYGYAWLDECLGDDGRLRGSWTGCDGAAGRMTASSGLHNMPAEMRPAVVAEDGHVFVRVQTSDRSSRGFWRRYRGIARSLGPPSKTTCTHR